MRAFVIIFVINSLFSLSSFGQDTLTVSRDSLSALPKKIKPGSFRIRLVLQKPTVVLLSGDCDPRPRVYRLYRETQNGWELFYEDNGEIILFCGPSQTSGMLIFLHYNIEWEGRYKLVLPIGNQKYFSGEIEVRKEK